MAEIAQEQGGSARTWPNWPRTPSLYNRYVTKLDGQETELEGLREELEGLKDTEAGQQRELSDYLLGLDLEG